MRSALTCLLCLSALAANAALLGRAPLTPGGTDYQAYYDTDLNITWLADANLANTNAFGVTGINANGTMTWAKANEWIAAMNAANYLGVNTWRLPTVTDTGSSGCNYAYSGTDCGYNLDLSTGEMAHMFYSTLGNTGYYDTGGNPTGCTSPTYCLTNTGPFSNLQLGLYWSGTTYAPYPISAWLFHFVLGLQDYDGKELPFNYAWAVSPIHYLMYPEGTPVTGTLSHGNGDTLGSTPPDSCNNSLAVIHRQNGDTTVMGDAFPLVYGVPYHVSPECPAGADHRNYPIRINSSGVVVGRSGPSPDFADPVEFFPWVWDEATGFTAIDQGPFLSTSDLFINDNGMVAGTATFGGCLHSWGGIDVQYSFHGFIWTRDGGVSILSGLVDNLPPYTCIYEAYGVTNSGEIFAGAITGPGADSGPGPYSVVLLPAVPDADGDGLPNTQDNCAIVANPDQADADGDGRGDLCDNCRLTPNYGQPNSGPAQYDANNDGYGNICDADLNNSGQVTVADYTILRNALNGDNNVADLNGSYGRVTVADYTILRNMLNKPPGPSGLSCAGTIPCPSL